MHISKNEALALLSAEKGVLFKKIFEKADIEIEIYKPEGKDLQNPHDRDEVYFVAQGSGMFQNGTKHHAFQQGDLIFVAAQVEHRFYDFTIDFSTWVLFFGEKMSP